MNRSKPPWWSQRTAGIPLGAVTCVHAENYPGREDLLLSRNSVAVVRPSAIEPQLDEEHELDCCYGPDASIHDLYRRTLDPLARKLVEGYNICAVVFGATGSGKTSLLEGRTGQAADDSSTSSPGEAGLVQLLSSALFDLLEEKQVDTGRKIAAVRQAYQARGFEQFVDCSFVEIFNETCRDLLKPESQTASPLAVVEDPEWWHVAGLRSRLARNADELAQIFKAGCQARDHGNMDLGRVHDRAAAIFTVRLAQFNPAAAPEDQDTATVSRLYVVDMPGSERLLLDPELLRLREGAQVNHSLLAWATTLRRLANGGTPATANQHNSVLTKLLSETLGGNCLTTVIGTVRQGEWDRSLATLKHLVAARQVYNYPVVNHGRVRGLLQRLRSRLMQVQGERAALQGQLAQLPPDDSPDSQAPFRAKVRAVQNQLADAKQEVQEQAAEVQALQSRLDAANDKAAKQDQTHSGLQEELIKSEEERLTISQALLTMQLDLNQAQEDAENTKFRMEQQIQLLEADLTAAKLAPPAASNAAVAADDSKHSSSAKTAAKLEAVELQLAQTQQQNERLSADKSAMEATCSSLRAQLQDGTNQAEKTAAVHAELKATQQHAAELQSQLLEQQQRNDGLQREADLARIQLQESREAFRVRIQHCMLEAADLQQACAIARQDPSSDLTPTKADFRERVHSLAAHLLQVQAQKDADAAHQMKELHARHAQLRHCLQALHAAYRQLRQRLEDQGSSGVHEDEVMGVGLDASLAAEEAAEQAVLTQLRNRAACLENDLLRQALDGLAPNSKAANRVMRRVTSERKHEPLAGVDHHRLQALDATNRHLQEELVKARRQLLQRQSTSLQDFSFPDSAAWAEEKQQLQRDIHMLRSERDAARAEHTQHQASNKVAQRSSEQGWPQPLEIENDRLRGELDALRQRAVSTPQHELRANNERLIGQLREVEKADKTRAQMGYEIADLKQQVDRLQRSQGKEGPANLRRQLKEFTLSTQLDLEKQAAAAQSRALVAEEQLQSLQHYISQSTVTYQKEIMRLRSLLSSQQQQHYGGLDNGDDLGIRQSVQRSGSAGNVLNRPPSGNMRKPALLRPIRSATDSQGQLSRPINERPAVDAWHAP